MKNRAEGRKSFRVVPDDVTLARLIELADICHTDPETLIVAIVRDVLEDDALAHADDTLTHGDGQSYLH
jgi:hypothetical protein